MSAGEYLAMLERHGARWSVGDPCDLRRARSRAEGILWAEPVEVRAACRGLVVRLAGVEGGGEAVEAFSCEDAAGPGARSPRWGVVLRDLLTGRVIPHEEQFPVRAPEKVLDFRRSRLYSYWHWHWGSFRVAGA